MWFHDRMQSDKHDMDHLLRPPLISLVIDRYIKQLEEDQRKMQERMVRETGIPNDSILRRMDFDNVACCSDLKRYILCCEQSLHPILCLREKESYLRCRSLFN